MPDHRKLLLSSVVLSVKEFNIGYLDSAVSCYFIRLGNLSYFYGNISATIDFKFFPFQIGGSNAVVIHVHHSSFGPPLTCLSSSISSIPLHQLRVIYKAPF